MLVAGYGTFITYALENMDTDMNTRQYSWVSKILGFDYVQGFRRVTPKGAWFPYAVTDPASNIEVLVVECSEQYLPMMDRVEGEGALYNRIEDDTKFGKAWMYVPTKRTVEYHDLTKIDFNDSWQRFILRSFFSNSIAQEASPQLFKKLQYKYGCYDSDDIRGLFY